MKFSLYLLVLSLFTCCQASAQPKWPAFSGGKVSLITGVEAEQRFKISEHLGTMELHGKPAKVKVALIEGKDIHMANLLDTEWGKLCHILIINGNLQVDSIISLTSGVPDLLVLGNLEAPFFYCGDSHQRITGTANIKYVIIGGGNDGSLNINGRTSVPYIISMDHDIGVNAPDAEWFDWNEGTMKELVREVYNPVKDQVDFARLAQLVEAGKPIKRSAKRDMSFKGIWKEWLQLYGRDSTALYFESFTTFLEQENVLLSMDYMDGYDLPAEIYELTHLEELNCMHVHLKSISPAIQQCKKLKKLNLAFCKLESIPKEIGNLSELEELSLSGNQLKEIPESIFGLKKLTMLYLDGALFTKEQQKQIQKRLPKTAVLFY
ncbi:MAG: leucine-rich repeat domain-containing protein [Haliscomenobacter sp.]|uniref:leucine-rich repeat domain-containing protein n=1 Tax=Haliscomenobacter sp. TaxID=2717303 RepID=UPI0029AAD2B3|nr:leucine-rich repeat domain-containing protein [Haliscomenobacter sp.]MDX2068096.1 leucine-rich repeat domain-containing protein [Haliscomenobacter sp.]